ncbi:MAG TPA: S9 family peptidase, partial [Bryobacteraceae bacterium]|nr:S9 family peptidase [Bryobacteraceae bacterium]
MNRKCFVVALILLGTVSGLNAAALPVSAADTLATKVISEVEPSPDGRTIVFALGTVDLAANKTQERLMRIASKGGQPEPVQGAPEGAGSVRWSPDGSRIAFIAVRDKSSVIYTLEVASGKLTQVCDYRRSNGFLAHSGNMLAWSPDGRSIAFAGTLEPDPPVADPLVVTRILYKTRTSFSDNRRTHIYVVAAAGGEPRAVTSGSHDEHSIDWGGDGREIVFLSNHEKDPDAVLNYDIFAVNVESGAIRQITHTPGVEMEPRVSPDGRSIAYTATKRGVTTIDSIAEDAHAWVVPLAGGEGKELNAPLDRRTSAVAWSPDGKSVMDTAGDHGSVLVCRTFVSTSETSCRIGKGAQVGALAVARDRSLAFTMSKADMPAELFSVGAGASEPKQLTHVNSEFSAAHQLSAPEEVEFASFDGTPIQGWFYPALNATGRRPMILTIHGGPHGQFGYAFNPQAQFFAGRGYAVLAINPRGSSGYGQKFSDGSVDNWGGGDYKDLMAGVDRVLATHVNIDPDKLFVTGGSYGGFMTNWVITQTNRFKAAVSVASVSDMISFYATSMYQDLVHAEFRGFPWADDNYALLWKWSPLAHVEKVTTPTMFLHGENDNDVHITQAEQMFTALRQRGIESELVRYPREGHGFREPKHRVDSTERT